MTDQFSPEIERLLQELRFSTDAYGRRHAAEQLGDLGQKEEQIIEALKFAQRKDRSLAVKNAAVSALHKLGIDVQQEKPKRFRWSPIRAIFAGIGILALAWALYLILDFFKFIFFDVASILGKDNTPHIDQSICSWHGTAIAFLDENEDGALQYDEALLPEISVQIFDKAGGFQIDEKSTAKNGKAELFAELPGCEKTEFDIIVTVPEEYLITTPGVYHVTDLNTNQMYLFGFKYHPEIPTLIPQ